MSHQNEDYVKSELYRIRHSTAHIMAEAVVEMFPDAHVAIGPAIEDGFYYDFDLPRSLTPDDLEVIENRMKELIKSKENFVYNEVSADIGIKLRDLTGTLNNWTQTVQAGVFTVVVFVGAKRVTTFSSPRPGKVPNPDSTSSVSVSPSI